MNQITTYLRHRIAAHCKHLSAVAAICSASLAAHAGTGTTTTEQLIGATQSFLEAAADHHLQTNGITGRHQIKVQDLDPRLRLAGCAAALDTFLERPAIPVGRVTVRVQCSAPSPWTLFVPAQVRIFQPVVMLTRPLKRGSILTNQDLVLREQDVGPLKQGYLTEIEQALDKKLKRPVMANQILLPVQLQNAEVIRKGEQVVITARTSTINVRMPGEALSDGAAGEQIRVKNQRSNRVIKARVVGPGLVEASM